MKKQTISLNGAWEFAQAGQEGWQAAVVPGCVHTDLLATGQISDPYYRDNESRLQWIGERDWVYRRQFEVSADLLEQEMVILRCHGLDTLAELALNGCVLGRTNNQFRLWEFDVRDLLVVGENRLVIRFDSALNYGHARRAERYLHCWNIETTGGNYLRKSPCNFGWDWGPVLITCGVWRDIELVAVETAQLDDVRVVQNHVMAEEPNQNEVERVELAVQVAVDQIVPDQVARVRCLLAGELVVAGEVALDDGRGELLLMVERPQLWWPNGLGEQPLYQIEVELLANDALADRWSKKIGLRTLELVRELDEWGESFFFRCNGVPFFAKGANWIPADTFVNRVDDALYRDLLESASAAHMNMLRVWGGGIYEPDIFYELCDTLGICVWQDFMFACSTYPTFEEGFMANVVQEAREQVGRLRHHACLALWCGNNELEQGLVDEEWTEWAMSWVDYSRLFDQTLRDIVGELDPHTPYWPGSPHSPLGDRKNWNNPNWGDAHIWDVWHGMEPFEFYRTCMHRFNSEFGFQSFPEPATLDTVLLDEDKNITSFVMEQHQKNGAGNSKIMSYMLDWFRFPSSFENTIWLSQIQQGMAIKYAVEHWRRTMPRGMGTLYWQLNDCWPVASWSSLDSLGSWKALHYMARHFFAPLLLSAVESLDDETLALHVTYDVPRPLAGRVVWEIVLAATGDLVGRGQVDCELDGPASERVTVVDLAPVLAAHDPRDLLVRLQLLTDGAVVAHNLVHLSRPKHVTLQAPVLSFSVEKADGTAVAEIKVKTDRPALWCWLSLEGSAHRFSDNFFHLFPDDEQVVVLETGLSAVELEKRLIVSSLWQTH